jgi:ubiquitin C-terminal hydrolase
MNNNLINYNNLYLLRPFGLYNSHILCYFNSLLQSLFSCTSLTEYILNNEKKFEEHNFMKLYIIILKKYILLDKETFDHQLVESSNILMFNEFLILIKNKNIKFGFTQEDSGELLVLLLDIINDNYIYNLFYNKYKCDIYCKNCKNCKNIKDDISIQFEIDSNNITSKYLKSIVDKDLHDFNKYIRNNYSEFDNYKCENCNQINNCIKINRLTLAPTILVINFNKYVEKKNYIFPAELFFINQPNNKKYNYRLISTINHSGNTNSGHYISKNIRKTLTIDNNNLKIINQIYKMNDSSYNIDTLKPESDTYIIFYHYIDSTDYYI